ncbi:MAG: hypothetical protein Q9212_002133 [Teloschistes hypoglaucus]
MEGITENQCIETAAEIEEYPNKLFCFLKLLEDRTRDINNIAIDQGYADQDCRKKVFATNQAMYRMLNVKAEYWASDLMVIRQMVKAANYKAIDRRLNVKAENWALELADSQDDSR